jgi:hypothetical protein
MEKEGSTILIVGVVGRRSVLFRTLTQNKHFIYPGAGVLLPTNTLQPHQVLFPPAAQ